MNRNKPTHWLAFALYCCCALAFLPLGALADDIDIFTGSSAGSSANPNVLIVLDNTSNWARHSQQWPGGLQQGQSEARAISTVLDSFGSDVNIGLMEFVTEGNSNNNGGFVRSAIRPMTDANKASFKTNLSTIYTNITSSSEKRNSNTPYGNLMYDVYNYYAGTDVSMNGSNDSGALNPPNYQVDSLGYSTNYSRFSSPLSTTESCARNFLIFIGNPNSSGPSSDDSDTTAALEALGGDTTPLRLPNFTSGLESTTTTVGQTSQCYTLTPTPTEAQTACGWGLDTTDNVYRCYVNSATETAYQTECATYAYGCIIGPVATTTSNTISCSSGTQSYTVTKHATTTTGPTAQTPVTTSATSSVCYENEAAAAAGFAAGDHAGLTCPASTIVTSGDTTTTTTHNCTYTLGSATNSCSGTGLTSTGTTSACYISANTVSSSDHGTLACPSGYRCSYSVGAKADDCGVTSTTTSTAQTSSCYATATAATTGVNGGDHGGLTCPADATCSYSVGSSGTAGSCAPTTTTTTGTAQTTTAYSTSCYNKNTAWSSSIEASDKGGLQCPSTTTTTSGGTTTTTTYSCSYSGAILADDFSQGNPLRCGGNNRRFLITQTATPSITTSAPNYTYPITQTAVISSNKYTITQTAIPDGAANYTVTQTDTPYVTTTTTTSTVLGQTGCYSDTSSAAADYASQCTGTGVTCTYGSPAATTNQCPSGKSQYSILGLDSSVTNLPTGTTYVDNQNLTADEWARFLFREGVPVGSGDTATRRPITTFTIDVYNQQQNALHTSLLMGMARAGGGKYYTASNEDQIVSALKNILTEIQAVNTTFASASLPISATNRAQNENQVFIGMFRPNESDYPQWVGNMKRYQVIQKTDGSVDLGDANGDQALSATTGFLWNCATSYWSSDSDNYWEDVSVLGNSVLALKSTCTTSSSDPYSDVPDGPIVEKGAVAEIIRRGNNPPTTNTTPTWEVNRTIYTLNSDQTALATFSTGTSGLTANTVSWVQGHDNNTDASTGAAAPEKTSNSATNTRPTVHGDVIHSRPLPVNYGSATGIYIYYGANDGMLRAVNASTGKEQWSFIAPEASQATAGRNAGSTTTDPLTRLKNNAPKIYIPGIVSGDPLLPKDYFFDGSLGLYQNEDNSNVWIYASMRRGGRMIYAFDVHDPLHPTFKWRNGCPNLTNDTGCTLGLSDLGQTWSTPNVGLIKGYSTTNPVLLVGGGYDSCEDTDHTITTQCNSAKGRAIYVFNANTGAFIKSFSTTRSVAADVAYADVNYDGYPDYAYAADTGGNIYRINFINPADGTALDSDHWTMQKIAYTDGEGRKFLFAPAPLPFEGKVYLAMVSGDREHPLSTQYPFTTPVTNRLYLLLDNPSAIGEDDEGEDDEDDEAIDLDDTDVMSDFTSGSTCSTQSFSASGKKGWFMSLNQNGTGEQGVSSALIFGGMVAFSTNRPLPPAQGVCSTSLGEARGYLVDLLTGSGSIGVSGTCGGNKSSLFTGGGMPPSPVMATTTVTGVSSGDNGNNLSSIKTIAIGVVPKSGGIPSALSPTEVTPSIDQSRRVVYWKSSGDSD